MRHHAAMSLFDDRAAEWDTPERVERARSVATAIREHVALTPDLRVIEFGAGTGLLGLDLLADVRSVVLAEPSAGMLDVVGRKIEAGGLDGAEAIAFELPSTEPPPGAPFDLAVSLLMLHHVEDTEATLRSVHAALRPGGRIALVDLDAEDGSFHASDEPVIHHHGFEAGSLQAAAEAAGFQDVEIRIVDALEKNGRQYPLFLLTGRRPNA
jgi:cyclopropane fatty-acyl-phospholipid synthase-like methyltransferase